MEILYFQHPFYTKQSFVILSSKTFSKFVFYHRKTLPCPWCNSLNPLETEDPRSHILRVFLNQLFHPSSSKLWFQWLRLTVTDMGALGKLDSSVFRTSVIPPVCTMERLLLFLPLCFASFQLSPDEASPSVLQTCTDTGARSLDVSECLCSLQVCKCFPEFLLQMDLCFTCLQKALGNQVMSS